MKHLLIPIIAVCMTASAFGQQATTQAAQAEAIRLYPDIGKAGSAANNSFLKAVDGAKRARDPVLSQSDWPLVIAKRAFSTSSGEAVRMLRPDLHFSAEKLLSKEDASYKSRFVGFTAKGNLVFQLEDDKGTAGVRLVDRRLGKVTHSLPLTGVDGAIGTWISMHSNAPVGRLLCLVSRKGEGMGAGNKKIQIILIDENTGKLTQKILNYENPTSSEWSSETSRHYGSGCVQAYVVNGQIAVINNYYLAILDASTLEVKAHTKRPQDGTEYLGGYVLQSGGIWRSLDQTKGYRCDFGKPAQPLSGEDYRRLEGEALREKQSTQMSKAVNGIVEIKPSRGGNLRLDTGMPELAGDAIVFEEDGVCLISYSDAERQQREFFVLPLPK